MDNIWRKYQMNLQVGMATPAIGHPIQSQGMDALLTYLQLPTQTHLVFELGMVVHFFSEEQDEQMDNPILLLMKDKTSHHGLLQPTETRGKQVPVGLFGVELLRNYLLASDTPDVKCLP